MIEAFAPEPVEITDDVLFGDVWLREELSPRDRSFITVAALIIGGNTEQLPFHLKMSRNNGLSERARREHHHLAFYFWWPKSFPFIYNAD